LGRQLLIACGAQPTYSSVPTVALAIIEEGRADLDFKDKDGYTPLFWATLSGLTDVVIALLATGKVDINAVTAVGQSALMLACLVSNETVAMALLNQPGINVNAKTIDGRTALKECGYKMPAVRMKLLELGGGNADQTRRLLDACKRNEPITALAIIAEGEADLNSADEDGFTPLILASTYGLLEVVTALLETNCVDINARTNAGFTALSIGPVVPGIYTILIDKLLEGESPIYLYAGHATDIVRDLKDVSAGCTYVNMGTCGLVNRIFIPTLLDIFKNPNDKRFVNPLSSKPHLESLLDGLSIKIYLPNPTVKGERYVNNMFHPIRVFPMADGFVIEMSGLINRRKSVHEVYMPAKINANTIRLEQLLPFFSMSVYPTPAQVDDYFRRTCADHLEALTYNDLNVANHALQLSVEELMTRFPGIHYNFLCRGSKNLPSHPAILRRANSVEAGRASENAIKQSFSENYPFIDLLETALLYEARHIPYNKAKLLKIRHDGFRSDSHKDVSLKISLLNHLINELSVKTWNPPEFDMDTKKRLLSEAERSGFLRSMELLSALVDPATA